MPGSGDHDTRGSEIAELILSRSEESWKWNLPGLVGAASTVELAREHLALAARVAALEHAAERGVFLARYLFQMIDQETWRASGGDDGQGHYEGDYRAEKILEEICALGDGLDGP